MRPRRFLPIVALALVTMLLVAGPATTASASTRTRRANAMLMLMNRARERHGLSKLRMDDDLADYAYRHSKRMAAADTLFHSTTLTDEIQSTTDATWWGENIAMGTKVRQIFRMWMNSAPHRANILNSHYRHTGIGIFDAGKYVWATADFYG